MFEQIEAGGDGPVADPESRCVIHPVGRPPLTSHVQVSVLISDISLMAIFNVGVSGKYKVFERCFQGERAIRMAR